MFSMLISTALLAMLGALFVSGINQMAGMKVTYLDLTIVFLLLWLIAIPFYLIWP